MISAEEQRNYEDIIKPLVKTLKDISGSDLIIDFLKKCDPEALSRRLKKRIRGYTPVAHQEY